MDRIKRSTYTVTKIDESVDKVAELDERLRALENGSGANFPDISSFPCNGISQYAPDAAQITRDWDYWQENNDNTKTSATLTAEPVMPCLLVAAVMHRGNVEIAGDGWEQIAVCAGIDPSNRNQRITVWARHVSAGSHTVTVTQNSERMSLKLICLYNAIGLEIAENRTIPTVPTHPVEPNGKRRLYLLSSAYASTSNTPPAITATSGILRAEELRFSVFYDPTGLIFPEFSYFGRDYDSNYMNILTLEVQDDSED